MQLSRETLLEAYRVMRTIRAFEDRVHQEGATGDIPGSVHLYAGQEASAVGVCLHLNDADSVAMASKHATATTPRNASPMQPRKQPRRNRRSCRW